LLDPRLVTLQGARLGLLMAPVELVHQPPYVISVVLHAEGALDYRRDARGCPQFSTVSVGDGALQ